MSVLPLRLRDGTAWLARLWRPRAGPHGGAADVATTGRIRLLEVPRRSLRSPQERRIAATLNQDGPLPVDELIERVARDLYLEEVRLGAWAVDIGVYGPKLFFADTARAVEGGRGVLWEIDKQDH